MHLDFSKRPKRSPTGEQPGWREVMSLAAGLAGVALVIGGLLAFASAMELVEKEPGFRVNRVFLAQQLHFWFAWLPLLPLTVWMALRLRLEKGRMLRALSSHALLLLALVPIHKILIFLAWHLLEGRFPPHSIRLLCRLLVLSPKYYLMNLPNTVIWYSVFASLASLVGERRLRVARELKAARLEGLLSQMELRQLKAQLHPHFLFNALNALSALVKPRPVEAQRMVGLLGELLRRSLRESHLQLVPLAKELETLQVYMNIEQIRFAGHLTMAIEADPSTSQALVPHLILQPLVENAVRHGIGPKPTPGNVWVRASREGDRLRLLVEDDGVGPGAISRSLAGEGIGLTNTTARLAQVFGPEANLRAGPRSCCGFVAELDLPFAEEPQRSAP